MQRKRNRTCRSRGWRKSRRWSLDGIWVVGHQFHTHTHTNIHTHGVLRWRDAGAEEVTPPSVAVLHALHAPPRSRAVSRRNGGTSLWTSLLPRSGTERDPARCAIGAVMRARNSVRRQAVSMKNAHRIVLIARARQGRCGGDVGFAGFLPYVLETVPVNRRVWLAVKQILHLPPSVKKKKKRIGSQ